MYIVTLRTYTYARGRAFIIISKSVPIHRGNNSVSYTCGSVTTTSNEGNRHVVRREGGGKEKEKNF